MRQVSGGCVTTSQYRKSLGLCYRCNQPRTDSKFCPRHRIEQQDYAERKRTKVDARPEPPRAPYVSNALPVMPPVPSCCPRCKGLVVTQYSETRCLLCAWYLNPVYPEPMRERYHRKDLCLNCSEKVEAGYKTCAKCRRKCAEWKQRQRSRRKVAG